MSDIDPIKYFINGGVGGVFTVLIGHPFDTLKVKMQTIKPKPGEKSPVGVMDIAKKIMRQQGPLGFYAGVTPPLLAIAPIFAMSFFAYGLGKKLYSSVIPDKPKSNQLGQYFFGGGFSAVFATTIMAPGERIKCILQIQGTKKTYSGPWDVVQKIYKETGIRGLYKGTCATLLREIPGSGSYFLTYEVIRNYRSNFGERPPAILDTIFAGGMAGVVYWLVCMPADVLKTRLQTAPENTYPGGLRQVYRQLVAKEGHLALYKGLYPVMARAFPANAACFLGYELSDHMLKTMFPNW